ncbi:MAG: hypothetical protein V7641_1366 [Blastocatellia bacterium]
MTLARFAYRRALVLSALLVASSALNAVAQNQQAARQDPLRRTIVYHLADMDRAVVQQDIAYKTVNGATLKLDAYYPPGTKAGARLPVVIFINGVGDPPPDVLKVKQWGQYTSWPRLVAAMGMAAIAYESRTTDATADSADLIDYVRQNAASLKVDENRLCLWACSANVRAGLPLAMQPARAYLRCAVIYYGAAQVQAMRDDLPVLMVRAGLDSPGLNNGIEAFAREAIAGDVPLTVINYVDGQHAFDLLDDTDESREVIKQTVAFMKFHLTKPEAVAARRSLTPARFVAMLNRDGIDKALRSLDELKRTRPDEVVLREFVLNQIGYRLLQDRKTKEAIEIFKFVAAAHPDSANVYDSLADAYEGDGNREMAIQFAEKALEKLATDTNIDEPRKAAIRNSASDKLRRLRP